ncbi:MAG: hypothetical protein V7K76_27265 [Nostoc sp.]|uniref:hypothetical protein n=1 Tax=Nostoc sp. TaxID=1180 RepID=UPI002FF97451
MGYKLSRRQFGQLVLAGTVVSGFSYLTNKVLATTPTLNIVGIGSTSIPTDPTAIPEVKKTELYPTHPISVTTDMKPVGLELVLRYLTTGSTQVIVDNGTPLLEANEILNGFTSLRDGTLVVAITPVATSRRKATHTRLIFLSASSVKTLRVSGLNENQQLGSLLGTNDGRLIGLVGDKNGTPPITLVDVDLQTGTISPLNEITIPKDERVRNLAECPDGNFYTSLLGRHGETSLVQLGLNQEKPTVLAQLKVNGQAWNNGLQNLVCSGTGQLLAFGATRYNPPNAVYNIDKKSGNMTRLENFDVTQIALLPG